MIDPRFRRIVLLVMDSVGVGAMPDADRFGDAGSNTLGHVVAARPLSLPNLSRLGLANIGPLKHLPSVESLWGSYGKLTLASQGKDTTSGHWEMMGLILDDPFPTYPDGFPEEVVEPFEKAIGRQVLGNLPASGTQIIEQLGEEHLSSGRPIVYTSADSVFQIAAHEEAFGLEELYRICEIARCQLKGKHEVGRVIARPFLGQPGSFYRTSNRKDYAIPPFLPTVLDHLIEAEEQVTAIGKIASIYCGRGISAEWKTVDNNDTARKTITALEQTEAGLIFANFVDFDMLYGHRNDVLGYGRALEAFDLNLSMILPQIQQTDLLILTSDHGCDPSTESTDHSREYALLLAYSPSLSGGRNLKTRESLADIGATVAENFDVMSPAGESFLQELR